MKPFCFATNGGVDDLYDCTKTCDPNNMTLALEQCAGLGIQYEHIGCGFLSLALCTPGTGQGQCTQIKNDDDVY